MPSLESGSADYEVAGIPMNHLVSSQQSNQLECWGFFRHGISKLEYVKINPIRAPLSLKQASNLEKLSCI